VRDKDDVRQVCESVEIKGLDRRNDTRIVSHIISSRGPFGLGTHQDFRRHCLSNGYKTYPMKEDKPSLHACIFQIDITVEGEAEPR
jgi:hypothetical protein